jgi:hypothetical protein
MGGDRTSMLSRFPESWSELLTFKNNSQKINESRHRRIQVRTIALKDERCHRRAKSVRFAAAVAKRRATDRKGASETSTPKVAKSPP